MQQKVILHKRRKPGAGAPPPGEQGPRHTGAPPPRGIAGVSVLLATCAGGLEEILAGELAALGRSVVERRAGAVYFSGGVQDLLFLHQHLRTASRLFVPLKEAPVREYDDVYRVVHALPWEQIIPVRATFAIESSSGSSALRDHRFLAMRVKDAIVDRQREHLGGRRSSVHRDAPDVRVVVRVADDRVALSLDASGAPLHERGYRREAGDAPLRETLAAGMVLAALQRPPAGEGHGADVRIIDPFCGSGTIAIEAALILSGGVPGDIRDSWGFLQWPWQTEQRQEPRRAAPFGATRTTGSNDPLEHPVIAMDRDARMVDLARRNARRAGVEHLVTLVHGSIESLPEFLHTTLNQQDVKRCRIVTNPPWGERLAPDDLQETYRLFGDVLRATGIPAWVLAPHQAPVRAIGHKPTRKQRMFNGGLACSLLEFTPPSSAGG